MNRNSGDIWRLLLEKFDAGPYLGSICNRPWDVDAQAAVHKLNGKSWPLVSKDAWVGLSVIDALTDSAFVYYLPSLLYYSWDDLPYVELSFDSLLYDLKPSFETRPRKRSEARMFGVGDEESRRKIEIRNRRFGSLGPEKIEVLSDLLSEISIKWKDDIDFPAAKNALRVVQSFLK